MNKRREPKKSDTLDVRLSHEVKTALMRKARAEGRSASEIVRESIGAYLAANPKEARSMLQSLWKPAAAFGSASLAVLIGSIAPAPVHARPDLQVVFMAVDRNGDGRISAEEFQNHPSNPAVQKLHEGQKGGFHERMAAMHGGTATKHSAPPPSVIQAHFAQIDANSDGSLTFEEFQAFHDAMKASHDAD